MTDIFYYFYKIRYYDEEELRCASGIVYGNTWSNAMSKITNCYGEREIYAVDLFIILSDGSSDCELIIALKMKVLKLKLLKKNLIMNLLII